MWSLKIARAFKMSETTQAIGFLIPKAFDRVYHDGFLRKFKPNGIFGLGFGPVSSFLRQLFLGLNWNSLWYCPINTGFFQEFIIGPTFFLSCINVSDYL